MAKLSAASVNFMFVFISRLLFWGILLVAAGRAFILAALLAAVASLLAAGAAFLGGLHLFMRSFVLRKDGSGGEGHCEKREFQGRFHDRKFSNFEVVGF